MRDEALKDARILVVDDLEPSIRILTRMLAEAGYESVRSCTDPIRAASLFEEFDADLLLLDLLPDRDGLE